MQIGAIKYHCLKCFKPVTLTYIPVIQSNTDRLFANMFNAKLCLDCYTDSKIPQTSEAVRRFLCH